MAATAQRGIWLEDSRVRAAGPVADVLSDYRSAIEEKAEANSSVGGKIRIANVRVTGPTSSLVSTNEPCRVTLEVHTDEPYNANLYVGVTEGAPTPIFAVRREVSLEPGVTSLTLDIPRLPLPAGKYFLWCGAYKVMTRIELAPWHPIASLPVVGIHRLDPTPGTIVRLSPVFVESSWTVERGRPATTRSTPADSTARSVQNSSMSPSVRSQCGGTAGAPTGRHVKIGPTRGKRTNPPGQSTRAAQRRARSRPRPGARRRAPTALAVRRSPAGVNSDTSAASRAEPRARMRKIANPSCTPDGAGMAR